MSCEPLEIRMLGGSRGRSCCCLHSNHLSTNGANCWAGLGWPVLYCSVLCGVVTNSAKFPIEPTTVGPNSRACRVLFSVPPGEVDEVGGFSDPVYIVVTSEGCVLMSRRLEIVVRKSGRVAGKALGMMPISLVTGVTRDVLV